MTASAAIVPYAQAAGREIDVVVDNDEICNLPCPRQLSYARTGHVHILLWLDQPDRNTGYGAVSDNQALNLRSQGDLPSLSKPFDDHESHVVTRSSVGGPGIAEADDDAFSHL